MAYQPIFDGEFDLADFTIYGDASDLKPLLHSVFKVKLVMLDFKAEGPGGGNPVVKLRGTRKQLTDWIKDYYDVDTSIVGRVGDQTLMISRSDDETWAEYVDSGNVTFVA